MTPIGHDEAFVALGALAIDVIDASERAAIDAHVATCDICRAELEVLRETAANLAFAAPPAADSAHHSRARIREHLSARATSEGQARRLAKPPLVFPKSVEDAAPVRPRVVEKPPARWPLLMAIVLFVASGGLLALTWIERDRLQAGIADQTSSSGRTRHITDSLTAVLASRDSMIASLTGRDVALLTLTSRSSKDAYARLYWDHTHNGWTLFARNMPSLKSGRTYQLWFVTTKGTVSAGTFSVEQHGTGFIHATFAVAPENLRAVAITEEPAGGVPLPTGETILASQRPS